MSLEFVKYEKIVEEFKRLEKEENCPSCGSSLIYHTCPLNYRFLCGECGRNFILKGLYNEELESKMIAIGS